MFASAMRHHQAGRLNDAEQLYRQVLKLDARHVDALHLLGVLSHQVGRNDAAVELIGQAIASDGRVAAFHNNLGNALRAQGQLVQAAASYQRALARQPDYVEAHYNLGIALQEQGLLAEAAASYRRALAVRPNYAEALCNLGNTLQAQGEPQEAMACYQRALARKPDYAQAHSNLGNVLKICGRLDEAIACYRRALSAKPDYSEAHNNLGIVLFEQGQLDEAAASFERALAHQPRNAEAHNNLGNVMKEQGRADAALTCYRRALALKPDYAEARLDLAIGAIPVFAGSVAEGSAVHADFARALDELAHWCSADPGKLGKAVGSNQPFYLAYRPFDVTGLLGRYGELVCSAAAAWWRGLYGDVAELCAPRDRIRLAVVSGQVRAHAVWEVVLRGIVAQLDRRAFEIFIYHTGAITDRETAWAASQVDRFIQGPRPTPAWLAQIREDRPDVLFYPEVGMDHVTCALAALRLAPLQVAGWGHPVTTGLPTMDLFLSAQLLEPELAGQHYRERLVLLPGTGVCTQPAVLAAKPWGGPARQPAVPRFALCQQPIKFDPADDVLLARIAKAVGPSEFWLASPGKLSWATDRLRDRLAVAFRAQGLDPDAHLRVMPWLAREHFFGFLDEMDLYLDCPAFSGYTTALQALQRGLPIVTLEGSFLRQRLAAGLLRQVGITDGIAYSGEQYVELALQWARQCGQPAQWQARREALRRAAPAANDNRAAIRAFEQALVGALRKPRPSLDHPQ
jgi:protein O-GlcNAc transferase